MPVSPRIALSTLSFLMIAALSAGAARPQTCHDVDGDGALAGPDCSVATDCEDRSWSQRPGATEVCNGIDDDCDGELDEGCDRWCDEPHVSALRKTLPIAGLPPRETLLRLTDQGLLVVSAREKGSATSHPSLVYARSFDELGVPWAAEQPLGDPAVIDPQDAYPSVARGGDRAFVGWNDVHAPLYGRSILEGRLVDDLGLPIGEPLDLYALTGKRPESLGPPAVSWDGEQFVVFWVSRTDCSWLHDLHMTRIDPRDPASAQDTVISDDAGGFGEEIDEVVAVWTGTHHLVLFQGAGSGDVLSSRPISREGVPGEAKRFPELVEAIEDVALAGDRLAVLYEPGASGGSNFALLDLEGQLLDPPGTQRLPYPEFPIGTMSRHLAWTGEMLVMVVDGRRTELGEDIHYWYALRLLPDGTPLDGDLVDMSAGHGAERVRDVAWAGNGFHLLADRATGGDFPETHLDRIVCSCADNDGDGFDPCYRGDCDDGDASVNPQAAEVCRGALDEDCNGLVDCRDPACPAGSFAGVVDDLAWSNGRLAWTAVPGAEVYDLARGEVSELARRGDLLVAECAGAELPTAAWNDDGRRPPAGDALWYVVRAEGAPCARGPWGIDVTREVPVCR